MASRRAFRWDGLVALFPHLVLPRVFVDLHRDQAGGLLARNLGRAVNATGARGKENSAISIAGLSKLIRVRCE